MQLDLKELRESDLGKTELIRKKLMEQILANLLVVIIYRIQVNLMEASIMVMEHLVIITTTILLKWGISLTELRIQTIMDRLPFPNSKINHLWLVNRKKLKCKNQQSTFQLIIMFRMWSLLLDSTVIASSQDTVEVTHLTMQLLDPMVPALFTTTFQTLTTPELAPILSAIWMVALWTQQTNRNIWSLLPQNKKELRQKTMSIFNNKLVQSIISKSSINNNNSSNS